MGYNKDVNKGKRITHIILQSPSGHLFVDEATEEKGSLSFYVTSVWQQWEREADSDLQAQRYDTFDTVEELIRYLDREKRQEP